MRGARACAWLLLLVGAAVTGASEGQDAMVGIDSRHSSARVIVRMRPGIRAEGGLPGVSGQLLGDPQAGWRVQVKVDGRGLRFGRGWMDRITRSDAFLAVDRYPVIRFESELFPDEVLQSGGELPGELTLRGIGRPVSFRLLPSACARAGRDCDIQVEGTISRHAFGMNAHRAIVRDEVEFHIRVRLQPETAAP